MEKIVKEGKVLEEVLEELLSENNLSKSDVIVKSVNKKGKLFQGTLCEVTVYPKSAIYEEIKAFLKEVINYLGLEVNFEINSNEN